MAKRSNLSKLVRAGGFLLLFGVGVDVRAEDLHPIGPWRASVSALAYARTGPFAYAGSAQNGFVYRTTNDGIVWEKPGTMAFPSGVTALVGDVNDSDLVLAGTSFDGIFRSADAGETWTPATGEPASVSELVATSFFFFATSADGVYRSLNSGLTFDAVGLLAMDVKGIAHQPLTGLLFATVNGQVHRSGNMGDMWSPASVGLEGFVTAIACHPDSAGVLYAGGSALNKSTNAGDSWEPIVSASFPLFMQVTDIAFDQTNGARVYVADGNEGILRSTNGGGSWVRVNTGLGNLQVLALAAKPGITGSLLCGTLDRATYGTINGGASWLERAVGISEIGIIDVAVYDDSPIWLASSREIFFSTDGGAQWVPAESDFMNSPHAEVIAPDQENPDIVWAGRQHVSGEGDILLSTDGGSHWTSDYSTAAGGISDIIVDASDSRYVYAASNWNGPELARVIRTSDRGVTWGETPFLNVEHLHAIAIQPGTPTRLLLATNDDLRESTDRGESFHPIAPELDGLRVRDIVFSASAPNLVWVATSLRGVYRSTNGGTTFAVANQGMGNVEVGEIAIREIVSGRTLFATASFTLFHSTDDGDSWTPIGTPDFTSGGYRALAWEPDADRVLVGSGFRGLYAMSLETAGIVDHDDSPAVSLYLSEPWPNPLLRGGVITLDVTLERAMPITLGIYDVGGRYVVDIAIPKEPGKHRIQWDGRNANGKQVASGAYFVRLDTSGHELARKIHVVR